MRNGKSVTVDDVERAAELFADVNQSSSYLKKWEEKMLPM